jgi:hypothetical protein
MMKAARAAAATLAFVLELAMLAAFAILGLRASPNTAAGVVVASAFVIAVVVVWGSVLGPRAPRRLAWPWRIVAEMALLGLSASALAAAGNEQAAVAFAAAIVVRLVLGLATGLDRLDEADA